jgi:hypothetical protein
MCIVRVYCHQSMPTAMLRISTLMLAGLLLAGTAASQVPDYIPTNPEESLADKERKRFEERYREPLSRLFTVTSVSVAPSLASPVSAFGYHMQAGLDLRNGDAWYGSIEHRVFDATPFAVFSQEVTSAFVLTFNYDFAASRWLDDSRLARNAALGVGGGAFFSEADLFVLEVTPKYTVPMNRYWSMPVGVRFSAALFGEDVNVTRTFVGFTIGMKAHLFRRDQMERMYYE